MEYSCSQCGKTHSPKLREPAIIICAGCSARVHGSEEIPAAWFGVSDDLSSIQIGSYITYANQFLHITGRIRIQMRDDFRNFWCAATQDGKVFWICQALEHVMVSPDGFQEVPAGTEIDLRVGAYLTFATAAKLRVAIKAKPLSIQLEGELARFPLLTQSFYLVQGSNLRGNSALMVIDTKDVETAEMLWGFNLQIDSLVFQNTRMLDGWPK